jgi:hypothetical protein
LFLTGKFFDYWISQEMLQGLKRAIAWYLKAISKLQITLKEQVERSEIPLPGAKADEKAQPARQYVSTLKGPATL